MIEHSLIFIMSENSKIIFIDASVVFKVEGKTVFALHFCWQTK
jgi:hypothetical protein